MPDAVRELLIVAKLDKRQAESSSKEYHKQERERIKETAKAAKDAEREKLAAEKAKIEEIKKLSNSAKEASKQAIKEESALEKEVFEEGKRLAKEAADKDIQERERAAEKARRIHAERLEAIEEEKLERVNAMNAEIEKQEQTAKSFQLAMKGAAVAVGASVIQIMEDIRKASSEAADKINQQIESLRGAAYLASMTPENMRKRVEGIRVETGLTFEQAKEFETEMESKGGAAVAAGKITPEALEAAGKNVAKFASQSGQAPGAMGNLLTTMVGLKYAEHPGTQVTQEEVEKEMVAQNNILRLGGFKSAAAQTSALETVFPQIIGQSFGVGGVRYASGGMAAMVASGARGELTPEYMSNIGSFAATAMVRNQKGTLVPGVADNVEAMKAFEWLQKLKSEKTGKPLDLTTAGDEGIDAIIKDVAEHGGGTSGNMESYLAEHGVFNKTQREALAVAAGAWKSGDWQRMREVSRKKYSASELTAAFEQEKKTSLSMQTKLAGAQAEVAEENLGEGIPLFKKLALHQAFTRIGAGGLTEKQATEGGITSLGSLLNPSAWYQQYQYEKLKANFGQSVGFQSPGLGYDLFNEGGWQDMQDRYYKQQMNNSQNVLPQILPGNPPPLETRTGEGKW